MSRFAVSDPLNPMSPLVPWDCIEFLGIVLSLGRTVLGIPIHPPILPPCPSLPSHPTVLLQSHGMDRTVHGTRDENALYIEADLFRGNIILSQTFPIYHRITSVPQISQWSESITERWKIIQILSIKALNRKLREN